MNNNKIDPGSPLLALQQQQILLRMEYEYEKEEFQRQTETMGIARKVKRGLCWYPVQTGRNYYNSLNQLVIEIIRTEDKDIEHAFEFGRPVCFFQQDYNGKIKYMNFTATVSFADEERMVVVLPGTSALLDVQNADYLGVQLYFDETSYRAMFNALEDVLRAKGNRLAELRDTLLGTLPIRRRELYPVRFPWLNSTQEEAVNKVLCAKDVAIVHGPPGTGKTTTLVEAIYETLHRENQVLVCAQSNTAVDWIAEKLVDRGVPVLRIGNPTRVNDKMLSFTYERRFENHPAYTELWSVRKSIREIIVRGKACAIASAVCATAPRNWKYLLMKICSLPHESSPPHLSVAITAFSKAAVSVLFSSTKQHRHWKPPAGLPSVKPTALFLPVITANSLLPSNASKLPVED